MSSDHGSLKAAKSARLLRFFEVAVVVPTLGGLTLAIARDGIKKDDLLESGGLDPDHRLGRIDPGTSLAGRSHRLGFP
jgi:hypothetical protein